MPCQAGRCLRSIFTLALEQRHRSSRQGGMPCLGMLLHEHMLRWLVQLWHPSSQPPATWVYWRRLNPELWCKHSPAGQQKPSLRGCITKSLALVTEMHLSSQGGICRQEAALSKHLCNLQPRLWVCLIGEAHYFDRICCAEAVVTSHSHA